jgi:hypothetical protein
MRNPNDWRRKSPVEAASELNDGLGVDGAFMIQCELGQWIKIVALPV